MADLELRQPVSRRLEADGEQRIPVTVVWDGKGEPYPIRLWIHPSSDPARAKQIDEIAPKEAGEAITTWVTLPRDYGLGTCRVQEPGCEFARPGGGEVGRDGLPCCPTSAVRAATDRGRVVRPRGRLGRSPACRARIGERTYLHGVPDPPARAHGPVVKPTEEFFGYGHLHPDQEEDVSMAELIALYTESWTRFGDIVFLADRYDAYVRRTTLTDWPGRSAIRSTVSATSGSGDVQRQRCGDFAFRKTSSPPTV